MVQNKCKLSTYSDSETLALFREWKEERYFKSDSAALDALLKHYFNYNIPNEVMPETLIERINKVEEDYQLKEQKILELEHQIIAQNEQLKTQASFYKQQLVTNSAQLTEIRQVLIKQGIKLDEVNTISIPRDFKQGLLFTKQDILEGITVTEMSERILGLKLPVLNHYADYLGVERDKYVYELTYWEKDGKRYLPSIGWKLDLESDRAYTMAEILQKLNFYDEDAYLLDILGINHAEYIFYATYFEGGEDGHFTYVKDRDRAMNIRNQIKKKLSLS